MRRLFCIFISCFCLISPPLAQSNRLIKELKSKRGALQEQITEPEILLKTIKKTANSQLNGLAALTGQTEERKRYIPTISKDMEAIDRELSSLERQLGQLQCNLKDKKRKYDSSAQHLYKNHPAEEKPMFILSTQSLTRTYRRLRYVREYATYQRLQGEGILKKQGQVNKKEAEPRQVRATKADLLKERESEKMKLGKQEKGKYTFVTSLQKKQRGLQNEIVKKRREANQLNARVDRLIVKGIEKARKRTAEETRCEATVRKKDGVKMDKSATVSGASKTKAVPLEAYTMSKADRELSGDFVNNRGRLPMSISGVYIITSRYGQYAVEGLRNVKLGSEGIGIQGRPGAQTRAIFNSKVAAVFKLNELLNILIHHRAYISVYCNLSSALMKQGDTVTTKWAIGQVLSGGADGGCTVLHFQLRREKEKLNPESWLGR